MSTPKTVWKLRGKRLLPFPSKADDLPKFYDPEQIRITRSLSDDRWRGIFDDLMQKHLIKHRVIDESLEDYKTLNSYLFHRGITQLSEACNKLWGSAEAYYHLSQCKGRLCHEFDRGFLSTSTLPTLYYSEIAAIISILDIFGIGSISKKKNGNLITHNLVRTSSGFILIKRNEHIRETLGRPKDRWHEQILQMYHGFQKKGIELPFIDYEEFRKLKENREFSDYEILSQTKMVGTYGLELYFNSLPHVVKTIKTALECTNRITKPLPNKCDRRFELLVKELPRLAKNMNIKLDL
ncbi:MAG: hypothetical protein ACXAEN_18765 [Candidatus Thorarchaeota archaeon]|jgi:hypothetical protein